MASEVIETCQVEDYQVEGPRRLNFSSDCEYRCVPVYSFKNSEALMWIHHHDILIPSDGLPSDFISDLRRGCSVSLFSFFPFQRWRYSLLLELERLFKSV